MSRRTLLGLAGATAAATITACTHTGAGNPEGARQSQGKPLDANTFHPDGPVIDIHAHIYPKRYLDFLEKAGIDPASTTIARNMNASDEEPEIRARLRQMDEANVAYQVVSLTPQSPLITDRTAAVEAARLANNIYAEVLERHPDRFKAYAAVPFFHPQEAVAELTRALDDLHFSGVAINALPAANRSLIDPEFEPFFAELNKRGAVCYVHPSGNAAFSSPMLDHQLEWVNGAPTEDAIAVLHLLKGDYLNRFPHIKFQIAHLGGDIPFLAQRIEDNYTDWGSFKSSPRESLRKMWFDTANFFGPSLVLAHDHVYDPEKLLAGSDYPYFQNEKRDLYTRSVEYIIESGLSEKAVNNILVHNPVRLLGDIFTTNTPAEK